MREQSHSPPTPQLSGGPRLLVVIVVAVTELDATAATPAISFPSTAIRIKTFILFLLRQKDDFDET
jgi:hypothetical protein